MTNTALRRFHAPSTGQAMADLVVLFVGIMGALIMMSFYFQRGEQGSLFGTLRSFGMQFQGNNYEELHEQWQSSSIQHHVLASMVEVPMVKQVEAKGSAFGKVMLLDNLPTGPVPREPAWKDFSASSEWGEDEHSRYHAQN